MNFDHKNKMPPLSTERGIKTWWRWFNGGFTNIETTPKGLAKIIQRGHAYTACHNRYRHSKNFIESWILGLDLDTGDKRSSFESLSENEFIKNHASFLHTTPSHSESAPRSRVVFVMESPIKSAEKYAAIARALVWLFDIADRQCKDPGRLFFGSEGCDVLHLDNEISQETIKNQLLLPYLEHLKEKEEEQKRAIKEGVIVKPGDVSDTSLGRLWESLLEHILYAPDGTKYNTLLKISRTFGGYIASGYIGEGEAISLLENTILQRDIKSFATAQRGIRSSVEYGKKDPLYVKRHNDMEVLDTIFNSASHYEQISEIARSGAEWDEYFLKALSL